MKIFTPADKMASIVHSNYNVLPIINRLGVRLGLKDKTVAEVCESNGINASFFLAIVNTYVNSDYFPEEELQSFPPVLIVDYLQKTHQYYINYELLKIEGLLTQMLSDCEGDCGNLKLIHDFFRNYQVELIYHIADEENRVFPYILKLLESKQREPKGYSILKFEKEHSNVEEKLSDLRNLIVKYIEPKYNDNYCNEFLIALDRFETDIKDHARIEDKILVPMVLKIESQLPNA
jgi:regulator of cell morphogenesis and NO signaling